MYHSDQYSLLDISNP